MQYGTPLERFYEKVKKDKDTLCWLWIGGKKKAGYGHFSVNGIKVNAHRWAYKNFVGSIPKDYEIDHLCRNSSCVNPEHLEAVTLIENRRRRVESKTHCSNGHLYDEENTYRWTDRDGYHCRYCKTCRSEYTKKRQNMAIVA